jgi:hypothetical protein
VVSALDRLFEQDTRKFISSRLQFEGERRCHADPERHDKFPIVRMSGRTADLIAVPRQEVMCCAALLSIRVDLIPFQHRERATVPNVLADGGFPWVLHSYLLCLD